MYVSSCSECHSAIACKIGLGFRFTRAPRGAFWLERCEVLASTCHSSLLYLTIHLFPSFSSPFFSKSTMKLKEIHRTSTFAWSPLPSLPLLATGTVAGALDESFSNNGQLEIWAPDFLDNDEYDLGEEGQTAAKASVTTSSRYVTTLQNMEASTKMELQVQPSCMGLRGRRSRPRCAGRWNGERRVRYMGSLQNCCNC